MRIERHRLIQDINLMNKADPSPDCSFCPRLADWRAELREEHPDWHNAPVPCFGDSKTARLLIVGLAPGLRGANRTGRVFTGDAAGDLLYETLQRYGLARGHYEARADDGFQLKGCLITNAVRCVPPENKPTRSEIKACQFFLASRLESMKKLRAVVALGRIAHESVIEAIGARKADHPFKHGARHDFARFALFDSYHCSRRNLSTKILTPAKFRGVFNKTRAYLG